MTFKRDVLFWGFSLVFTLACAVYLQLPYARVGDSLVKTIQADSIVKNGFAGEELRYPARSLDPEFAFYPFGPPYRADIGDRHVGQYPVALSYLMAPMTLFPGVEYLAAFSLAWLFALLAFLRYYWGFSVWALLFVFLGTYLLPLSLDVSENSLMVFLNTVGVSWILGRRDDQDLRLVFAGGFVAGLSVWLRLEAIPFMTVFLLAYLFACGLRSVQVWRRVIVAGLAFSIPVVLFLLFNLMDYGHVLGPRFSQNYGVEETGVIEQLRRAFVLTFGGGYKVGLFAYLPVFLLVVGYFAFPRNFRTLSAPLRVLYISGVAFIPVAGLLAPNDGVMNIGPRYLVLSVIPLMTVTVHFWNEIRSSASTPLQWVNRLVVAYSVVVTLVVIVLFGGGIRQLKGYRAYFESAGADIWLFDEATCGFFGLGYFERPILCLSPSGDVRRLVGRLKEQAAGKTLAVFARSADEDPRLTELNRAFGGRGRKGFREVQARLYLIDAATTR